MARLANICIFTAARHFVLTKKSLAENSKRPQSRCLYAFQATSCATREIFEWKRRWCVGFEANGFYQGSTWIAKRAVARCNGCSNVSVVSSRGSLGICAALFGAKAKLTTSGDSPEVGFLILFYHIFPMKSTKNHGILHKNSVFLCRFVVIMSFCGTKKDRMHLLPIFFVR